MSQESNTFIHRVKITGFLIAIIGSAFSISMCGIGLCIYLSGLILQATLGLKDYDWYPYPNFKFLLPLLASLIISLFISQYFYISFRGFLKYVQGFLLIYAAVDTLRTKRIFNLALVVFVTCYWIASIDGIFQSVFGYDFIYHREPNIWKVGIQRVTGPFKHCNDFGTFLVPGTVVALSLFIGSVLKKKFSHSLMWLSLFAAISACIVMSISRSALISAMAAIFFFSLFFKFRLWIILGLVVALFLMIQIPSSLSERLLELGSLPTDSSAPERFILWETTLRMIQANPFFGLGLNTYSDYFAQFRPENYHSIMYSHNSYLQMSAESGLIGIGLYLTFLAITLIRSAKAIVNFESCIYKWLCIGLFTAILGLLTNAVFESLLQSTQLRTLFWILMGMLLALVHQSCFKEEANHE